MAAAGAPLTTTRMPLPLGRLTTASVLSVVAATPSSSARLVVKASASKVSGVASTSKPSDTPPSPAPAPPGGGGGDATTVASLTGTPRLALSSVPLCAAT